MAEIHWHTAYTEVYFWLALPELYMPLTFEKNSLMRTNHPYL